MGKKIVLFGRYAKELRVAFLFIHEKIRSKVFWIILQAEKLKECKTEKQDSEYYIMLSITKAICGRKQEHIDKEKKKLKIYNYH